MRHFADSCFAECHYDESVYAECGYALYLGVVLPNVEAPRFIRKNFFHFFFRFLEISAALIFLVLMIISVSGNSIMVLVWFR